MLSWVFTLCVHFYSHPYTFYFRPPCVWSSILFLTGLWSVSRAISHCPRIHIYPYLKPLLSYKFDDALLEVEFPFTTVLQNNTTQTHHVKDLLFGFCFQFIMIDPFVKYKTTHSIISSMSNCCKCFQMCPLTFYTCFYCVSCCGMIENSLWTGSSLWTTFWVTLW